jgi:O-antigen biosynthesis protein
MSEHPYTILAPPYRHNSAGVRALYRLGELLRERGYTVTMTQGVSTYKDAIAIYPETAPGNVLGAKTVVRWVLFFPGALGGDTEFNSEEIVFTYDLKYFSAPLLTINTTEKFFRDEKRERKGGCFWVGKGYNIPRIPETPSLTEITKDWPSSRQELACLFNKKEVFYTYDSCTALIDEAQRCGCKVIVIPTEIGCPVTESESSQISRFIRITQEAAERNNVKEVRKNDEIGCLEDKSVLQETGLKN